MRWTHNGTFANLRIVLVYVTFAVTWILVSDQVIELIASNQAEVTWMQTVKGLAFVITSALLLAGHLAVEGRVRDRLNAQLQEHAATLEQRVEHRTAQLAAAKERAERADRTKSVFLATMSHELRTPLNSIIGFTGILLKEMAGPLTGEQRKQLGMVRDSGRHLLSLINDVLDISKIEAGQLPLATDTFDAVAALHESALRLQPQAREKGLELTVVAPDAPIPLTADRRRVEQVLINLLSNAIKFTERGHITLRIAQEDDHLRLEVEDTGVGIADGDLEEIFQPFHQVSDGTARYQEGTGLGLAICKRLVDLHHGSLAVESDLGEGSRFIARFPLQRPARHDGAEEAP